jgi:hypothetical protein
VAFLPDKTNQNRSPISIKRPKLTRSSTSYLHAQPTGKKVTEFFRDLLGSSGLPFVRMDAWALRGVG